MPMSICPRGTLDRIEWRPARNDPMQHVLYSDVQGNPGTGQHPQRMQEAVQARLDQITPLADMVGDEWLVDGIPDSLSNIVWEGDATGKKIALATHIVVRSIVVTVLSWDGEKYSCQTARAK